MSIFVKQKCLRGVAACFRYRRLANAVVRDEFAIMVKELQESQLKQKAGGAILSGWIPTAL